MVVENARGRVRNIPQEGWYRWRFGTRSGRRSEARSAGRASHSIAAAPLTTSMISLVMLAWRTRFM
jgi:hypothetical protein